MTNTTTTSKQMFDGDRDELRARLWSLDLGPILFKVMDPRDGEGWTLDQALAAAEEYRRFLFLTVTRHETIVPTEFVDAIWHAHILDTAKYRSDCDQLFGFFLDHFPYFGMRGASDRDNLDAAFRAAAEIYQATFGTPYYVGVAGANCGTCGSQACGKCAGSGIESDVRPSVFA